MRPYSKTKYLVVIISFLIVLTSARIHLKRKKYQPMKLVFESCSVGTCFHLEIDFMSEQGTYENDGFLQCQVKLWIKKKLTNVSVTQMCLSGRIINAILMHVLKKNKITR